MANRERKQKNNPGSYAADLLGNQLEQPQQSKRVRRGKDGTTIIGGVAYAQQTFLHGEEARPPFPSTPVNKIPDRLGTTGEPGTLFATPAPEPQSTQSALFPTSEQTANAAPHLPEARDYQPQVTTTDLANKVADSLNTLIEAIKTGNTERLTTYLAFSSRFHRYSRRNQQLIFSQCPEATRVANYVRWKQEGYQVRYMDKAKGEKGISILVPKFPKRYKKPERRQKRTQEGNNPDQQPEDEYRVKERDFITHSFKVGTVFDVTHLRSEDQARVPRFFTDIEGDHEAVYERLTQAARREGIEVYESLDTQGAQGYSAMGLIVVRPDQPPGNKAAVIAHEWGHELLHDRQKRLSLPGQVKECHAEATAFVVLSHFGITIPYSVEYLINWGNNAETLRKELDLVTAAASQIITKVHALTPGEEDFHDQAEPDTAQPDL